MDKMNLHKEVKPCRSETIRKEIEKQFACLKDIPSRVLHPLDLRDDQFVTIKKEFPIFKETKPGEEKVRGRVKGIAVTRLAELLKDMIHMEGAEIAKLVEKIDHKHHSEITWEEYFHFLKNEGERREEVNAAYLYGLSTKRLKAFPKRHPIEPHGSSTVEYYIESMVMINYHHMRLGLVLMENNAAKLFDLKEFR
jgi:hypothetical protein